MLGGCARELLLVRIGMGALAAVAKILGVERKRGSTGRRGSSLLGVWLAWTSLLR